MKTFMPKILTLKTVRTFTLTLLIATMTLASAQLGLNPAAREALERGREAAFEALQTYPTQYPDRPLWRQAINAGREAVQLAPNSPEPLRFLAEVYTATRFYRPAWENWNGFVNAGGSLDAEARSQIAQVGTQLGFTAYEQGDPNAALQFYQRVIDLAPDNVEAYIWAGRILVETNRPDQAIGYWQTVVERDPGDERAQYFLELSRQQARWGAGAVTAFREGVTLYENGNLPGARERFARATSLNADYAEAWAWLGRVEFERENYQDAVTYYQNASDLTPGNDTYRYFLGEAQRRLDAPAEGESTDG